MEEALDRATEAADLVTLREACDIVQSRLGWNRSETLDAFRNALATGEVGGWLRPFSAIIDDAKLNTVEDRLVWLNAHYRSNGWVLMPGSGIPHQVFLRKNDIEKIAPITESKKEARLRLPTPSKIMVLETTRRIYATAEVPPNEDIAEQMVRKDLKSQGYEGPRALIREVLKREEFFVLRRPTGKPVK